MTNVESVATAEICRSDFVINSSFVIRHSSFRARAAFTLIELIIVVGIIIVLSGLVLSTVGYARKKGARARAETEIAAISAACENYKADSGVYPRDSAATDTLDAQQNGDPTQNNYQNASLYLFTQLSGLNPNQTPITGARNYFSFKPQML